MSGSDFAIERGIKHYGLEVARGNIVGAKAINKYGKNIEVDSGVTADIWSRGKTVASGGTSLIWVAPTQARTHTIASTSANDTSGGSGALTVRVSGLTSWTTTETSEIVTMNTGTPPTTDPYVIIHRMQVVTSGGTSINAGLITATATTDGTVTAAIEIGEGQTHMAIYGIPSIESLYIMQIGSSVGKAGGASGLVDVDLLVNSEPDAQLTQFKHKHHFGLGTTGSSGLIPDFDPPKCIAGPAIIKMQVDSGTNNMDIAGWFNGYVITN